MMNAALRQRQCQTWANPGTGVTLQASHEAVRKALTADSSPIRSLRQDVFLQGSYKNDTNVRGDSDVDVVVQLISNLSSHYDRPFGVPTAGVSPRRTPRRRRTTGLILMAMCRRP